MRKIALTLSLIFLSACQGSFPKVPVFIYDEQDRACREYKIIDQKNLKFEFVKQHEPSKCQKLTGFLPKDFKTIQNWARDEQQEICKRVKNEPVAKISEIP